MCSFCRSIAYAIRHARATSSSSSNPTAPRKAFSALFRSNAAEDRDFIRLTDGQMQRGLAALVTRVGIGDGRQQAPDQSGITVPPGLDEEAVVHRQGLFIESSRRVRRDRKAVESRRESRRQDHKCAKFPIHSSGSAGTGGLSSALGGYISTAATDSLNFRARTNGVIPASPLASSVAPASNNTSVTSGFELFLAA